MSYPGPMFYDSGHLPTDEHNEHIIHKAEGDMFTWCSLCREEEICLKCNGNGIINGIDCIDCESSGRRLP